MKIDNLSLTLNDIENQKLDHIRLRCRSCRSIFGIIYYHEDFNILIVLHDTFETNSFILSHALALCESRTTVTKITFTIVQKQ